MKVALGIVHDELIHARFVICKDILKAERPEVTRTIWGLGGPGNFDVARNKVARGFLEGDEDWLLTIDTDMTFHPEDLDTLLGTGEPVVSGIYFIDDVPPRPCMVVRQPDGDMRSPDDWDEGVITVNAVGGGFLLIHRQALLNIGGLDDTDRNGPWYRQDAISATGSPMEPDFALCQRLEQAGYEIKVNTKAFVGHIKSRVLGVAA